MVDFIRSCSPRLVVLEATAVWKGPRWNLGGKGFTRSGRESQTGTRLCQSQGYPAKTDKIDAWVIADFAEAIRPEIRPLKTEDMQNWKRF